MKTATSYRGQSYRQTGFTTRAMSGLQLRAELLSLPEAGLNSALNQDCALTVSGNLSRRKSDLCAGFGSDRDRRVDIIDEEIRSYDGLFRFVHRGTDSNRTAISQLRCPGTAKVGITVGKSDAMNLRVHRTGRIDICRNDFEIVQVHCISRKRFMCQVADIISEASGRSVEGEELRIHRLVSEVGGASRESGSQMRFCRALW